MVYDQKTRNMELSETIERLEWAAGVLAKIPSSVRGIERVRHEIQVAVEIVREFGIVVEKELEKRDAFVAKNGAGEEIIRIEGGYKI